ALGGLTQADHAQLHAIVLPHVAALPAAATPAALAAVAPLARALGVPVAPAAVVRALAARWPLPPRLAPLSPPHPTPSLHLPPPRSRPRPPPTPRGLRPTSNHNNLTSPARPQVRDEVVAYVQTLILSGQAGASELLRLQPIAEALGASITPVREGL